MLATGVGGLLARGADDLAAQVSQLYSQGKYAEAIPIAERYVELARRERGEKHAEFARAIEWLGNLYRAQGRFAEAEPLLKRSLAIREKALGPDHRDVAQSLNSLGELYWAQGRGAEVGPLVERSLAIREKALGPNHADVGQSLNNLAALYLARGRYGEAESLLRRSLAIREKALGPNHPDVGETLSNLALLYQVQGRHAEAESHYKRCLALTEKAFGPNHANVAQLLNNLAALYQTQGRYLEAEPLYKRAISVYENALGSDHPDVATSLNNLAELYRAKGRYGDAEPLYRRSLAIREKALAPEHPDVGTVLNNLAELYSAQGRYGEAEPLYKRRLAIAEKVLGSNHLAIAQSLNKLALLYNAQGRYAEGEPVMKRSLAIREKALGPDHPDVAQSLNNLAVLYQAQGRYSEAEPLYKRALAVRTSALGPDHPLVATSLNNLAELYQAQGRYGDAEPLLKRSLGIAEKALGAEHSDVGQSLNNLAALYHAQGRYAEAEPLYKRGLAIREKALGSDHRDVAESLNSLAALYQAQDRYSEAELFFKRSLAIRERALGPDHPDVGQSLNNLALLYKTHGRYAEAEPLYKRSLAIAEKALGPDHPNVGKSLNNLAGLYQGEGHYAEAEPLYKRSLAIREKALGADHPDVAQSASNLAVLYLVQSDWAHAADLWRRSTAIIAHRTQLGISGGGETLTGKTRSETEREDHRFLGLVKVVHRLALKEPNNAGTQAREMFESAQWTLASEAASSLAQMAARGAKDDPALAILVRERQDLVAEWQKRDGVRTAAALQLPDNRNKTDEAANVARLAIIDKRIAEIDLRLKAEFPDYAALASPAPLSATDVQALLGPDEALVLFLDTPKWDPTPEETFIWVVTRTEVRWVRSDVGRPALTREVAALRCGLDATSWNGDGATKCGGLLQLPFDKAPHVDPPLPFNHARAHALYRALFGEVEDLIKGKHLLLVPSGALTQLPFQVLVTVQPTTNDHRQIAWLAREHTLTVLPSVSSLRSLRQLAKASRANRTLIGFGNPLLDGPDARYAKWASAARSKQSCPNASERHLAASTIERRGLLPVSLLSGRVEVSQIRSQVPLPETADELCAVASDLGVSGDEIRLGERATETEIKRLSEAGELSKYRIIDFATHGAIAGQVSGTSEPGLLLTPPKTGSETDDGYLSASEIAALKLDADWVILSACNTAAGGAEGAGALSGLARAFFYAGARALLVSHWAVYSDATVALITGAVKRMAADKTVGRADALRQSMLAMIDSGKPDEAHPAYWAPFVVVGEGAAR
jgi:tetratricopeptide (TPR) repeat protein/CHAT domain-containing protein